MDNLFEAASNTDQTFERKFYGASANITWDLESVELMSLTAYRKGRLYSYLDSDAVDLNILDIGIEFENKQFSPGISDKFDE